MTAVPAQEVWHVTKAELLEPLQDGCLGRSAATSAAPALHGRKAVPESLQAPEVRGPTLVQGRTVAPPLEAARAVESQGSAAGAVPVLESVRLEVRDMAELQPETPVPELEHEPLMAEAAEVPLLEVPVLSGEATEASLLEVPVLPGEATEVSLLEVPVLPDEATKVPLLEVPVLPGEATVGQLEAMMRPIELGAGMR